MSGDSDEILSFIDKYGVINKDAHSSKGASKKKKIIIHKRNPRERLDLHGLTSTEAAIRFRMAIDHCRDRGIKELLVIHGIGYHSTLTGGPVLKQMVRQMLENELCTLVRDYKTALAKDGGDGATLIYLR